MGFQISLSSARPRPPLTSLVTRDGSPPPLEEKLNKVNRWDFRGPGRGARGAGALQKQSAKRPECFPALGFISIMAQCFCLGCQSLSPEGQEHGPTQPPSLTDTGHQAWSRVCVAFGSSPLVLRGFQC